MLSERLFLITVMNVIFTILVMKVSKVMSITLVMNIS